ncbi:MAG: imidazolonepropionase [Bacteroidota bacterium]
MNLFIKNIRQLVTVCANGQKTKTGPEMRDLGIIGEGAVLCRAGKVAWVGKTKDFAGALEDDITVLDGTGMTALPGFVDSHTHAVFAGSREDEFAMRSAGATYQQIAERGGGILSTIRSVRNSSKRELKKTARRYLTDMLRQGTTTVEVKSGYGLSMDAEIMMLEAIRELADEELMDIVATFLGAHAVPPEFTHDREGYVALVTETLVPYVGAKRLAEFCDVFCDAGYFTIAQTERILTAAAKAGLKPKVHAEELAQTGAAELAARLGATSADHLENISEAGVRAMGAAGVVAVLLPGVSFFLNHGYAPARLLIDSGVPVAIASDFNPGSCMSYSMPMMMTIACTQMHMSPEECITACTLNAAAAIDRAETRGSIEVGKTADILLADIPDFRFLAYHFGTNHIHTVIKHGTILEL